MAEYDYELFTLGAGSGGVRASRVAASYGARVAVAEERYLGGTCVNVGCVPKKLFVYASHFHDQFRDAAGFGWSLNGYRFDWSTLIANKDAEITRLNGVYKSLLENAGVDILDGHARLVDEHTVALGDQLVRAEYILVATGGWPDVPQFPGSEHVISSNEAFFLEQVPKRVVIIGGGYIAVEFAGIFAGLGADVVQLYRGPLFLRGFDDDIRTTLAEEMAKKHIDVRVNTQVQCVERDTKSFRVTLQNGETLATDLVMAATGRTPLTGNLGLERAGVAVSPTGAVIVDAYSRTSSNNIFAVGDCTDRVNLTPVAIREGQAVADTLFGGRPTQADHSLVPSAVFSQPPIGTVGLTEAAAREKYAAIDVYRTSFRPMKHTLSGRDERVMMKLVVDHDSDRVVGAHMVGDEAAEIIQGLAIALKAGATKADFDATVGIHPTSAEEFVTMRNAV